MEDQTAPKQLKRVSKRRIAVEEASRPSWSSLLDIGDTDLDNAVRVPIPRRTETLLEPGDTNFRGRRNDIVCPFRNFERERELLENASGPSMKKVYLGDLFRPPVEILFTGSFTAMRQYAAAKNQWAIVNVQDYVEFKSQCLNRDIWADQLIQQIIKKFFIFWQVSKDTCEDGRKFISFYNVTDVPFIGIIDPRTGCLKEYWPDPSRLTNIETRKLLATFIKKYPNLDLTIDSPKFTYDDIETLMIDVGLNQNSVVDNAKCPVISKVRATYSLTEEEQMAIAIQNSLADKDSVHEEDSDTPLDSSNESDLTDNENKPNSIDEITTISLRLPDGNIQKSKWLCTSTIGELINHIKICHSKYTIEPYKILFPVYSINLFDLPKKQTLKDAQLHPNAVIYLHEDL